MDRTAEAQWNGDLKSGNGKMKSASGAIDGAYTFASRFENGTGTNPEELLGAAHAGCFSMALANMLAQKGTPATSVKTTAVVHMGKDASGKNSITGIDLHTRGNVPGLSAEAFAQAAEETKSGCIVSRALSAVPMTVKAELE